MYNILKRLLVSFWRSEYLAVEITSYYSRNTYFDTGVFPAKAEVILTEVFCDIPQILQVKATVTAETVTSTLLLL